eukprot:5841527-Pleurochrysis_carterae.AAC.1
MGRTAAQCNPGRESRHHGVLCGSFNEERACDGRVVMNREPRSPGFHACAAVQQRQIELSALLHVSNAEILV